MKSSRAMTMHEAAAHAAAGRLDLAEIDAAMQTAMVRENPSLGAFNLGEEASTPSDTGTLAGFGAAIKSNICCAGRLNDCGSRVLVGYRSPFDATVVARLEAAGAHIMGTTAMDEFGMGSSCEHCAWGPAVNPWRQDRIAGGSSGGSAAAVAAGLAWFALGTDTGGSVRYPAHCCGLVGFKPTWGRVSRYGLIAFASSLDTVGVLARDVNDAARVGEIIAGSDPLDATTLSDPVSDWTGAVGRSPAGLRVGVPRSLVTKAAGAAVARDFAATLAKFQTLGVEVIDVELPDMEDVVSIYTVIACAEAASNLARFDGSLYGRRQPGGSYAEQVLRTRSLFGDEVKRRILMGTHVLSAGYRDAFYLRAGCRRRQLTTGLTQVLTQVDALALPTAAEAAFQLGSRLDDPVAMYQTDRFTVPASLAGLPAITVPTTLDDQDLPLSIQLIGPRLGEPVILTLAAALESVLDFRSCQEAPWHRTL